jgi:low affinity Fe/Cu permease
MGDFGDRLGAALGRATGSLWAWVAAVAVIVVGIYGNWFWTDAIATAATFVMVFVLQRGANANTAALHTKLDEIVRCLPEASDDVRGIEP